MDRARIRVIMDNEYRTWSLTSRKWTKIVVDENNFLHNENGTALENNDGRKWYFSHGKIHRIDGPAYENHGDMHKFAYYLYYYHGKRLMTKEDLFQALTPEEKYKAIWSLELD